MSENISWEAQCSEAAWAFGKQCAELAESNPYNHPSPLNDLINTLMTELWDHNFSQTEIRSAFEEAIRDMPRYSAGLERRDQGPY
jgi:hypothetical protein